VIKHEVRNIYVSGLAGNKENVEKAKNNAWG
jgi:hypothetical protein